MTASVNTKAYQSLDAAHHIHAFLDQKQLNAEGPRVITRGEGLNLWDSDGKRYLDGMSGLWCTYLGYGRKDLNQAAFKQMEELILPSKYSHAIYTNSGSESNELLIRTVRRYWQIQGKPEKKILIGRWNGYHGSTLGTAALGGMDFIAGLCPYR